MATSPRRRTITLRDGAQATLRPIVPEDAPLIAASFERLSDQSRYRRFFTTKNVLTSTELAYLVDVDHKDHEAIIAVGTPGEVLGVARYVRSTDDPEVAEVAVTVADDWQGRGLGRALLERLSYRARHEGVRRFSALVQGDNPAALTLLANLGETRRQPAAELVELIVELPAKRGMGMRLTAVLRAAAAGTVVPAMTLVQRAAVGVASTSRPPLQPQGPIRSIVVGTDGSESASEALAVALRLGRLLGAAVHIVCAYGMLEAPSQAKTMLSATLDAAGVEGLQATAHARRAHPAEALITVAAEQGADLLVVGNKGMTGASRVFLGSVPDKVSHHAPCSVLIVRG